MNSHVITFPAHTEAYSTTDLLGIRNSKDQYSIQTRVSYGMEPLELSEIRIAQPSGQLWLGNIQDFGAIQSIARNAFALIAKYGIGDGEELKELQQLLQHFNPGQPAIAIPDPGPTHERGKEMAMISCIMSTNFFNELVSSPDAGGVINSYDIISQWAGEFYDLYREFDWGEMQHADGTPCQWPEANGWEDVVVYFTREKMKAYYVPVDERKHRLLVAWSREAAEILESKGATKLTKSKKVKEGYDWEYKYFNTKEDLISYTKGIEEGNGWDQPYYENTGLAYSPTTTEAC